MMKRRDIPAGTLTRLTVDGPMLAGTPIGEPTARAVDVWLPEGHSGRDLPLLVDLAGFTGSGLGHTAWKNFGENLPERLARLVADDILPPALVAMPDGFTRLGGNQYVDSPVLGQWTTFLADALVPAVEARFGCGGPGRRGLFGKSSGGYGSLVNAIARPDVWAAAACLSGDMAFELCYWPDLPTAVRVLGRHGGDIEAFVEAFWASDKPKGDEITALMMLAMAASYDPDPQGSPLGIRLPVDIETCEVIPERWARWRLHDPLVLADQYPDRLAGLKGLWIECGTADEYNLLYGARRLHRQLEASRVPHEYREFEGGHSGIDWRLDTVLPWMVERLK